MAYFKGGGHPEEKLTCPTCPHAGHTGLCGEYVEIQHVEIECKCVIASQESLDKQALRRADAEQDQRLGELKAKERRRYVPRPQYVRDKH